MPHIEPSACATHSVDYYMLQFLYQSHRFVMRVSVISARRQGVMDLDRHCARISSVVQYKPNRLHRSWTLQASLIMLIFFSFEINLLTLNIDLSFFHDLLFVWLNIIKTKDTYNVSKSMTQTFFRVALSWRFASWIPKISYSPITSNMLYLGTCSLF